MHISVNTFGPISLILSPECKNACSRSQQYLRHKHLFQSCIEKLKKKTITQLIKGINISFKHIPTCTHNLRFLPKLCRKLDEQPRKL